MSGISKSQKEALIAQMQEFTMAIPSDAMRLLKANKWQINQALEAFYNDAAAQGNAQRAQLASSASLGPKLEALFDKYYAISPSGDKAVWSVDSTLAWCEALQVSPEDPVILSVAELCKATEMGSFDRSKWVEGWKLAKCETEDKQREYLSLLRSNMNDRSASFKKVYAFTFDYARDKSQRSLALEIAVPIWEMLFSVAPESMFADESVWCWKRDEERTRLWLSRWTAFLQDSAGGKGRPISKDVWSQFLDFACQMDDKCSSHDPENDAWPSLLDAFAEQVKEQKFSTAMKE